MTGSPKEDDGRRAELDSTYQQYASTEKVQTRWSLDNRGNAAIVDELVAAYDQALGDLARRLPPRTVIDLGCGSASLVPSLLTQSERLIGVDLLSERLKAAAETERHHAYVQADGTALPLEDHSADIVVLSTVLSSIPDRRVRSAVAQEAERVLRPGGAVLWYDFRYPNPLNRHTVHISRRELHVLFPGCEMRLRSMTVVPQLARRLGRFTDRLYPWLARVPVFRSHLFGMIITPPALPTASAHASSP